MNNQPPACITSAWTPVADRVSAGDANRWAYRITAWERMMLDAAVKAGTALIAQRRTPAGLVLLSHRVTPTHPAAVRVTAVTGRGVRE